MKNLGLLFGSLLLTLVAVIGVAVLFTQKTNAPVEAVSQETLLSKASHTKGKDDAKVTIVEFSDLQCPACKASQPLLKNIESQYKDQVKIVYRHFPLRTIHANAFIAAKASEAANQQGKFWEYHDKLFDAQESWEGEKDPTAKFVQYAKDLGLKEDQFKTDLNNKDFEKKITDDEADGVALNVNATPTFFVNGFPVEVNQLQTKVSELLAE